MFEKMQNKGSALVVSLMVLSVILVIAMSIALVSVKEIKTSSGSEKSKQAFQEANTGIEKVMQSIVKGGFNTVNELADCDAVVSKTIKSGNYEVVLKDASGNKIDCDSTDDISTIASIKSTGSVSDYKRAIEAVVAASLDCVSIEAETAFNGTGAGAECQVGFIATGGGCDPHPGGDVTGSGPNALLKGWNCSGVPGAGFSTVTAIAVCCKL